jgi:transcriptional pleiotropic regulator of transition state genes
MKNYVRLSKSGSMCIPIKLRRALNINGGDALAVEATEDGGVKLLPYRPSCVFCGATEYIKELNGKGCCVDCYDKLAGTEARV